MKIKKHLKPPPKSLHVSLCKGYYQPKCCTMMSGQSLKTTIHSHQVWFPPKWVSHWKWPLLYHPIVWSMMQRVLKRIWTTHGLPSSSNWELERFECQTYHLHLDKHLHHIQHLHHLQLYHLVLKFCPPKKRISRIGCCNSWLLCFIILLKKARGDPAWRSPSPSWYFISSKVASASTRN